MPTRGFPVARRTLITPRGTVYECLVRVRRQSYCEQHCFNGSRARLVVTCVGPTLLRQACPPGWCDLSTTMLVFFILVLRSALVEMRNYLNSVPLVLIPATTQVVPYWPVSALYNRPLWAPIPECITNAPSLTEQMVLVKREKSAVYLVSRHERMHEIKICVPRHLAYIRQLFL
jgi:hypothetical protein